MTLRGKVGKIADLVAEKAESYPMIIGFVVRTRGRKEDLPWEKIVHIEPQITLPRRGFHRLKTPCSREGYHPPPGRGDG